MTPDPLRAVAGGLARDAAHEEANDLIHFLNQCSLGGTKNGCTSCRSIIERALRKMWDAGLTHAARPADRKHDCEQWARDAVCCAKCYTAWLARPTDRTAEREAARKAYEAGWMAWRSVDCVNDTLDAAREAYLAAEFDAGERVTPCDQCGFPLDADKDEASAKPRHTIRGCIRAMSKRLAEQRGAER